MTVFEDGEVGAGLPGCHSATATANTLTTQYMVRFSHLTVQLPENPQTSRGNYSKSYIKYMFYKPVLWASYSIDQEN